jgi:Protein of unknown function (DUF3617)
MNTRFAKIGAFAVFFSLATFAAVHALHSQTIQPPPMKMGLWQTESNATIAGMENTPMGQAMGGKHSNVTQGCLTPETWKSTFEKMNDPGADCKMSNLHQDSRSISFDEECTNERHSSKVHFEGLFDDDEHGHGSAKAQITAQGLPQSITMNMTFTSHYLGASCGDVKPGEGKVISHQ